MAATLKSQATSETEQVQFCSWWEASSGLCYVFTINLFFSLGDRSESVAYIQPKDKKANEYLGQLVGDSKPLDPS